MLIHDTMMRGGTRIRQIIAAHLAAKVPAAIDIMRIQNNDLNEYLLPYPVKYDSSDPLDSKAYPTMGAFVTGADSFERKHIEPSGALEYNAQYETTMFVTASTAFLGMDEANLPKYEHNYRNSALRIRDDLTSIFLNCILNWPSLGTAGTKYRAMLDESSLRVSYPEPFKRGNDANPVWICSSVIVANINLTETTVVPYYGNLAGIDVTTSTIDE